MAFDGTLKFDTKIDTAGFQSGLSKIGSLASTGVKAILGSIAAVSAAMVGAATAAVKVGSDFEAGMSQVSAISGATGKDLDDLTAKAKEMGAKTKFSAAESADAFQYMAMAGWKTADMLDGIEGIMNLAAASGEDLASVSDIVTDALTAFGLQAKDSAHFSDVLAKASSNSNTNVGLMGATFKYVAPIAGAMKYSIEDTATAIGLLANAGIKGEQAGTSLRAMLTRLVKPTDEVAGAMDALGINMTNADGTMKPLREVIGDLRESFSKLSDSEKAEYAANIAGQEAMSGLLAIVNASDDDFESLTAAIDSAEGAASDMATTMQDNLQGRVEELKGGVETLGIEIYESMQEPLKKAVETGIDYIGRLSDAFTDGGLSGAVEEAGNIFADLATRAAQGAPKMIDAAVKFIQSFLQGIQKNSSRLLAAAQGIVKALVDGLVKLLPKSVQKPVNEAIQAITKSFNSSALKNAIKTVGTIITNLAKVISNIAKVVIPIFNSALGFLGDNLEWILPLFVSIVTAVKTMQLLQQAAAWWTAMSKSIEVATGSLTLCQTAVGVLTGKVELATIAQGIYNTVLNSNPIGAVIVLIEALVIGIGLLCLAMEEQTDYAQKMNDAIVDAYDGIADSVEDYQDKIKSSTGILKGFNDELIVSSEKQQELQQQISDVQEEITTIADAAASERRALTQSEIDRLDELFAKMHELTAAELDQMKAYQEAVTTQAENFAESFSGSLSDYADEAADYIAEANNARDNAIEKAREQYYEEYALQKDFFESRGLLNSQEWEDEKTRMANERDEKIRGIEEENSRSISAIQDGYDRRNTNFVNQMAKLVRYHELEKNASDRHLENMRAINEDLTRSEKQRYDDCSDEIDRYAKELAEIQDGIAKSFRDLDQDELESWVSMLANTQENGGKITEENQAIAEALVAYWDGLPDESKEAMGDSMQAMIDKMRAMKSNVATCSEGIASAVTTPFSGFYTSGWNAGKNLINGAIGAASSPEAEKLRQTYYNLGYSSAHWYAKGAGCASPSKLTRKTGVNVIQGAELGLKDEAPKLLRQTDMLGESLSDSLQISPPDTAALVAKMRAAVAASSGLVSSGISAQANYRVSVGAKQQEASTPNDRSVPQTIQNHISIDGREFAIVTTPYIEEEMAYR